MALSEERRETLLTYCREEEPTPRDLMLIEQLYESAVGYMTFAGVSEPKAGTQRRAQYDLCVNYMVSDAYDRRDETITGTIVAENPAFRRLLNQLKRTEFMFVSKSDTSGV